MAFGAEMECNVASIKGAKVMPYGPGKFEREPASTFILSEIDNSGGTDECASHPNLGYWAKFEGAVIPVRSQIEAAQKVGYTDTEILDSVVDLINAEGAIMHENDQGFVSGTIYNNEDDLNDAWSEIEELTEGAGE